MEATVDDAPTPGTLRADVWIALYAAPDGLTDAELNARLAVGAPRIAPLVWRDRRAELVAEGAVLDSGRTRDGATVWVTRRRTPEASPPLPAPPEPEMQPPPEVSDNRPTALLVDAKNLLYRSLHSRGEAVEVDFPKRLRALLERYTPRFAILAWDADGPTWRHAAYADYKGQRDAPSAYELGIYAQVPGWAAQCGYQFVEAPGWEADDIIGTYTARLREAHRVVIVSNDKDFAQLLDRPGVIMLKGWDEVITDVDVPRIWGVQPRFIPDLLAIMGDTSDNIPGVPKVGEVGAAKLVNLFGGCEAIIDACKSGKDKAKGRSDRIVESAVALRLFLRLTTISTGIADLAAPVECSSMPPSAPGKREALDGMTVLDGVMFPLPETAHMAAQHGWRWSNPTSMPERKQSQLRPGEPIERWEKEDHWGYLVERGGQWTLTHRGVDGDIETGKAHLAEALGEFRAYHVAYMAMADALYGVKVIGVAWSPDAPVIAAAKVAEALADARGIVARDHARLLAATGPTAVTIAPEHRIVEPPRVPMALDAHPGLTTADVPPFAAVEYPSGVRLLGVELGTPDGAVALGTIELPGGFEPGDGPSEVEVRVTLAAPMPVPSAPMLPPRALVIVAPEAWEYWCPACRQLRLSPGQKPAACGHCGATAGLLVDAPGKLDADALRAPPPDPAAVRRADVAAAYGVDPASLTQSVAAPVAEPPWAIPTTPGQTTIPVGYARTIVALTLEAFSGEPQLLVWDVDLKSDLGTPPDEPTDPNGWADGRWTKLLDRLSGAVAAQANDPGATKPLVAVVRGIAGQPYTAVMLDLSRVNVARIANGPPPVGRWFFAAAKDALAWGPRVERNYFMEGIPF